MVAANGSVYTFGDATYHGSRGGKATDGAIVGIAVDHATGGYWLVTSRGAVYAFDAPNHGSAANLRLVAPVVGMAADPDGTGYWLAGSKRSRLRLRRAAARLGGSPPPLLARHRYRQLAERAGLLAGAGDGAILALREDRLVRRSVAAVPT